MSRISLTHAGYALEVIKTAELVIDLGPEGDGEIFAWDPPEDIVQAAQLYRTAPESGAGQGGQAEEAEGG